MQDRLKSMAAALAVMMPLAPLMAQVVPVTSNPNFESTAAWTAVGRCAPTNDKAPSYSGSFPSGWEVEGCDQGGAGVVVVTYGKGVGANGSGSSLVMTSSLPEGKAVARSWINPGLTRGDRYTVTLMLKVSTPSKRPAKVRVALRDWLFPFVEHGINELTVPDDGLWHKAEFTAYAPVLDMKEPATGGDPAVTYGGIFVTLESQGTLAIDDLSLVTDRNTSVSDIGATRRDKVIPKAYFGMHVHGHDPNWPTIGQDIGTERLWDAGKTQWGNIMANPAQPDWTDFDNRVLRASQNGAEVIMVLGGNIPTAVSSDQQMAYPGCSAYYNKQSNTGQGSSAPPIEDGSDGSSSAWKAWVTALANHVKGLEAKAGKKLVQNWEVWNEPDHCQMFFDNPARLARLVASANSILKSKEYTTYGDNKVLSPSIIDVGFLDRYLRAASDTSAFPVSATFPYGPAFFDVLSMHLYDDFSHGPDPDSKHSKLFLDDHTKPDAVDPDSRVSLREWARMHRSPEAMFDDEHLVLNARQVLQRFPAVAQVPVWSTEGGYLAASLNNGPNDTVGARFVARHLLLGWAGGIERNVYYAWDHRRSVNEYTGQIFYPVSGAREAVEGDGIFKLTEGGLAYQQVSKWMSGAQLVKVENAGHGQGTWVMTLQRNNAQAMVVWNPDTEVNDKVYTLPYGHTSVTNLKGEVTITTDATINVGPAPVLVTAPATRVVIKSSASSIKAGQAVSFTATISGGWRIPSGTVQFKANGVNLGSAVPVTSARTATLTTSQLTKAGYVSITAEYSGDTVNLPNNSATPYIEIVKP